MTGLEVVQAQAFYHQPEPYVLPLSSSLHYAFDGGATAVLSFYRTAATRVHRACRGESLGL